jgi:hypothetical protein
MPEVTQFSPELSRSVSALAGAPVAASRNCSLYPPEQVESAHRVLQR